MAVDPSLYPDIEGSTDSETLFFLALTFGLTDDPFARCRPRGRAWWRRSAGHGVDHPVQMTVATTDGDSIWAFRYSSEGRVGRCSSPPTSRRCVNYTPNMDILREWARKPGWWSPNHWAISGRLERGARVFGRGDSSRARMRSDPSSPLASEPEGLGPTICHDRIRMPTAR